MSELEGDTGPTITVGQNAYLTLDAASAIADTRLFAAAWTSATTATQAKALLTATALLDRMQWQGRKVASSQSLAFPRVSDFATPGYPLTTEIPPAIITASVELAIHLLKSGDFGGGPAVQMRMLGDSNVMHFSHVADELPKHVRRLIEPHLRSSSANIAEVQF